MEGASGFFTLYRQPWSQRVIITTDDLVRHIQIIGTPIISNGRVIDINYNIDVKPSRKVRKTTITIDLQGNMLNEILDAATFIHGTLNLIDFPFTFNGQVLKKHTDMVQVYDDDFGTVWVAPATSFESVLFTNGVPFAKLSHYLAALLPKKIVNLVGSGIKINIKRGKYTPVQSRNRIYIEPEKKQALTSFFLTGIYYAIVESINRDWILPQPFIPFIDSEKNPQQLFLSRSISEENKDESYIVSYRPTGKHISIAEAINSVIIQNQYLKVPLTFEYIDIDDSVKKLIRRWFSNKKIVDEATAVKNKEFKEVLIDPLLPQFFSIFVEIYWTLGIELENMKKLIGTSFISNPKPPSVKIVDIGDVTIAGSYNRQTHTIKLQHDRVTDLTTAVIQKLIKLPKKTNYAIYIRDNDILARHIGDTNPTKTIIHELTHAALSQGHEQAGSHDTHLLTLDGDKKKWTFEDSSAKIYNLILQKGLLTELITRLKAIK